MGILENNMTFSLAELITAETGGKLFEFLWCWGIYHVFILIEQNDLKYT